MPETATLILACFGLVFFGVHLVWMVVNVRAATNRDRRIEAVGIIVPGLAGLMMVVAAFVPDWLKIVLVPVILADIVVGRAVYEVCLRKQA